MCDTHQIGQSDENVGLGDERGWRENKTRPGLGAVRHKESRCMLGVSAVFHQLCSTPPSFSFSRELHLLPHYYAHNTIYLVTGLLVNYFAIKIMNNHFRLILEV